MSSEATKFLLVDASNIDKLFKSQEHKERLTPMVNKELKHLDRLLLEIINNNTLSEEEKVVKYNKVLAEFQSVSKEAIKPILKKSIVEAPKQAETTEVKKSTYNPTIGITQRYKSKAETLMSLLRGSGAIDVSNTGEVIIKNEKIPYSNISDLLNKAINPQYNIDRTPGWEKFESLLTDLNVPQSLLGKAKSKSISKAATPKVVHKKPSTLTIHNERSMRKWTPYDSPKNVRKQKAL